MELSFSSWTLREALSNSSFGKSSLGLFLSLLFGLTAIGLAINGAIMAYKSITGYSEVFIHAGLFTTASTTLLVQRRMTADKEIIKQETN